MFDTSNAFAPILIRGVEFPNAQAVAKHFNLTLAHVKRYMKDGREQFIGIAPHRVMSRIGPEPSPVRIRGKVYPSAKEAARVLGVTTATIYSAIQRGREDFIGLGRSRKHSTALIGRQTPTAKKTVIFGRHFRSRLQAARFMGVPVSTMTDHIEANDTEWILQKILIAEARADGHTRKLPYTGPDRPEIAPRENTLQMILAAMVSDKMTARQIAQQMGGYMPESVAQYLRVLEKRGIVESKKFRSGYGWVKSYTKVTQ